MRKTSDTAEMLTRHSDTSCAAPTISVDPDDRVLTITDDVLQDAAIALSEIDAIERYMSDILDVVLGEPQTQLPK